MKAPADIDKCLAILVLRRAGCSQDMVTSIMHCAKATVVEVENWFKQLSYSEAVEVCSEEAIKGVIDIDLVTCEEVEKKLLQKVMRITPDVILRHYRQDHLLPLRWQETKGLAVQLQSSMFNISAKDWAIWGLPDTGKPTQTSEAGLRLGRDRGELVVKLSVEMDQSFPLFMARLKAFFQEFGYYDQWRESLTDLVCRCADMAHEIQIKAETETGLFLSTYPMIGKGHLINVPKYIYEFALDNCASMPQQPVLEILENDPKHCWVVPGGLSNYALAMGSKDEMEKCKKVTASLSVQYAKDERMGKIVAKARQVKDQTASFQSALSAVIEKATGGS